MARYDKSPKVEGGKVKRPEDAPMEKAKETAGSPPSAEDPKGAMKGGDEGPEPGRNPMGGDVADRHKSEMKDMLARHKTEHEQMVGRHHEEISKMGARHAKETAPDKDDTAATKKVEDTVGKPKELGKEESEGKKGEEP